MRRPLLSGLSVRFSCSLARLTLNLTLKPDSKGLRIFTLRRPLLSGLSV
eukprot:gene29549-36616_t